METATQIIVLTKSELLDIISEGVSEGVRKALSGVPESKETTSSDNQIKGIKGLSEFLKVSHSHAQKIKNSGILPYFQVGKTILFDKSEVIKVMKNADKEGRLKR